MYWGSVRFFKHVILGAVAILLVVSIGSAFYFGFSCHRLAGQVALLSRDEVEKGGMFTVYAAEDSDNAGSNALLSYQKNFLELYVENNFSYVKPKNKTVYLTFDDGPSSLTPKVLDILKQYGVKATFFIVYKDSDQAKSYYKRMVDEGHTLAVHSTTHIYKQIYASVDAFLNDFEGTSNLLEDVTGTKPQLFRFPGGSINAYNRGIYMQLIAEMMRRGYTYYDWNVGSNDTAMRVSAEQIEKNVVDGVRQNYESNVLMHDAASNTNTLAALPGIIETLQSEGYSFAALDQSVRPVTFGYVD